MNMEQFINSTDRNGWIKEPGISIYIRRSFKHSIDFELANMNASKPGKGALTKFLDRYELEFKFHIENILNERLIPYFTRRGYHIVNLDVSTPCMER